MLTKLLSTLLWLLKSVTVQLAILNPASANTYADTIVAVVQSDVDANETAINSSL